MQENKLTIHASVSHLTSNTWNARRHFTSNKAN